MSSSASTPAAAAKPQRVLACVLCQSRKVKCDRNFPCSNCVKTGANCVPAGSIPRQRRRRFPERELLDRLRSYEGLLRKNNIAFEPLHPRSDLGESKPITEGRGSDLSSRVQAIDIASSVESHDTESSKEMLSSETIDIWNVMNQRSQSPSEADETEIDEDETEDESKNDIDIRHKKVRKALSHMYENDDDIKFTFGARSEIDPATLHPSQVNIIRIWQIYLDNVNPMLKVTHTPTLQARIIEAAANLANVPPSFHALMFGIYCVSMLTISDDDCLSLFGSKCGELLKQFQLGCRQAMLRSGILRTNNRDCLTALYLYLLSTKLKAEPRSLLIHLGIAIRIAQSMGMHSESANSKHAALEAEMRRRLWWAIVLLDTRISEMTNFKAPILLPGWDCKPPSNINDFDLTTETKVPPAKHGMITEASFTVVRSELANFVRYSGYWLDFTNPCLKPLGRRPPAGTPPDGDELAILENMVGERYLQFCNPDNPLHFMIIWMTRGFLAKNRLLAHYARHARMPTKQTEEQRDLALNYALTVFECDTKFATSPLAKVFTWFSMTVLQFPFMSYIHVAQDLGRRPTGKYAARAWAVMSESYTVRFTNLLGDDNPLAKIISKSVLHAWEARKVALGPQAQSEPVPSIIEAMKNRTSTGMTPEYSTNPNLPSWLQPGANNDDAWMPMPDAAPEPVMNFGTFDPTYPFAWSDPLSNMQGMSTTDTPVGEMNWGNMDWSSLRDTL